MPKIAKAKSAGQLARIKKPGLHNVGGVPGLLLQVSPTGARSWIVRVSIGQRRAIKGKKKGQLVPHRHDIGLGSFGDVKLADARERARSVKQELWEGKNPIAERKAARTALAVSNAKQITFADCAAKYISAHRDGWRNAKHAAQWESTLATYAKPINALPVDAIDTALVMRCIESEWATKNETMSRVRGRIERVLAWATVRGFRQGDNPAQWRGHLDQLLPESAKVQKVEHRPALPFARIHDFMAALQKRDGQSAKALEFQILTAVRPGEVRNAVWGEFDLAACLWTIPAARMKMEKEHVVPLSPAALKLLKAQPRIPGNDLVFPSAKGGALSDMAMAKIIRDMHDASIKSGGKGWLDPQQKRVAVAHGFRSTFRDWASESTAYPRDVCEMALAHTIGNKAEAAYRRGDLLTKRTRLMADWAKFIGTAASTANVTPIRKAKA